MGKEMRHIIRLEKEDGSVVEFERWSYKDAQICINKMVELYDTYGSLYLKHLEQADRVVCYPTPDGYTAGEPVWSATREEFLALIEQRGLEKSKKFARTHLDWIETQTRELKALLALNTTSIRMNKSRAMADLDSIQSALDSLRKEIINILEE